MNEKGFTLVELLAVIVVLGLITTIATISISRNRQDVNEKEKETLRQTIISGFENYRINNVVLKGNNVLVAQFKFDKQLSYNNKQCNYTESNIKYVLKKDKLSVLDSVDELSNEERDSLKQKLQESLEEVFCVTLYCNGNLVINDEETSEVNEVIEVNGISKQVKVNYCK